MEGRIGSRRLWAAVGVVSAVAAVEGVAEVADGVASTGLGGVATEGAGGAIAIGGGGGGACGRAAGTADSVFLLSLEPPPLESPPLEPTMATTRPPASTATPATIGQRRPVRGGVVLAPAAPEMVDGVARRAGPGSSAASCVAGPTMLRVRCTEIAACVCDCAYGASSRASSATF